MARQRRVQASNVWFMAVAAMMLAVFLWLFSGTALVITVLAPAEDAEIEQPDSLRNPAEAQAIDNSPERPENAVDKDHFWTANQLQRVQKELVEAKQNRDRYKTDGDNSEANRASRATQNTVLITGGMGALGVPLIKELLAVGWNVIAYDAKTTQEIDPYFLLLRKSSFKKSRYTFEAAPSSNGVFDYVQGDINDHDAIEHIFATRRDIAGVIHLAIFNDESTCDLAQEYCDTINVNGTYTLVQVLNGLPKHHHYAAIPWLLFASSSEVYGNAGEESGINEAAATRPETTVGRTLLAAEQQIEKQLLSLSCKNVNADDVSRPTAMILRFGHVYGSVSSNHNPQRRTSIGTLTEKAINGAPIILFDQTIGTDSGKHLDYVHVHDAVQALRKAVRVLHRAEIDFLESTGEACAARITTLNIGSGDKRYTMPSLVDIILKSTNSTTTSLWINLGDPSGSLKPAQIIVSKPSYLCTKASQVLDYTPQYPIAAGIATYVEDIKSATLHWANGQAELWCGADPLSEEPNLRAELRYQQLQSEVDRVRTTVANQCVAAFENYSPPDGIKEPSVEPPICRNNNGAHNITTSSYCTDLRSVVEFINNGYRYKTAWLQKQCPSGATISDLPVCEFHCDHPTICIQTGRCKCADTYRCPGVESESVQPSTAKLARLVQGGKIQEGHERTLMPAIMTPFGRMVSKLRYPNVHVIPRSADLTDDVRYCLTLGDRSCFTATLRLMHSIKALAKPPAEADMFIVPFYHGCSQDPNAYWEASKEYLRENDVKTNKAPMVWIMVHDWSKCHEFHWSIADKRGEHKDAPLPIMHNVPILSTNGDTNTNCFNPVLDVVIPAQTCLTPYFAETMITTVVPPSRRPHTLFLTSPTFGGCYYLRKRLLCPHMYPTFSSDAPKDLPAIYLSEASKGRDEYFHYLRYTKYCLVPRGTTGWSTRMIDVMALGCVPVLISDYTIYPFQDILDYNRFAVFVRESELPYLEHILDSISPQKLEDMQQGVKIARHALIYLNAPLTPPMMPHTRYSPADIAFRSLHVRFLLWRHLRDLAQ